MEKGGGALHADHGYIRASVDAALSHFSTLVQAGCWLTDEKSRLPSTVSIAVQCSAVDEQQLFGDVTRLRELNMRYGNIKYGNQTFWTFCTFLQGY